MTLRRNVVASRQIPALLVGCALLAVTGCAATADPSATSAGVAASATTTGTTSADEEPDVASCADGTCEIRVDKPVTIPLDPQFDVTDLRVESIESDTVTIEADSTGGTVRCEGNCSVSSAQASATEPTKTQATLRAGSRLIFPKIAVEAAEIDQGTALLRVGPP